MGLVLEGATRSPEGKPRLHHTALNMLRRCGIQFVYRYVENSRKPPGIAALVGRGTHKAVEHDLKEKIATGKLLPDSVISDVARDGFYDAWESGVHLSREEREDDVKKLKAKAVDQAVELAVLHHDEVAPMLNPELVETWWHMATDAPFDLSGVFDVIETDGRVRDTKTKKATPSRTAAATSPQLSMYALARHVHGVTLPVQVALDTLVKTKTPKKDIQLSERTADDLAVQERRIQRAFKVIESESFLPADPDDWACSERYCGWFQECKFAKRPVTSGAGSGPATTPKKRAKRGKRAKRAG